MRISKKVREEAALICAIAASNGQGFTSYIEIENDLGEVSQVALGLAASAWLALGDVYGDGDATRDAEAEALIRTGWSPGDKP